MLCLFPLNCSFFSRKKQLLCSQKKRFINTVGFQNSQTTRNILPFIFCFIFHFIIRESLTRDQIEWQYFYTVFTGRRNQNPFPKQRWHLNENQANGYKPPVCPSTFSHHRNNSCDLRREIDCLFPTYLVYAATTILNFRGCNFVSLSASNRITCE